VAEAKRIVTEADVFVKYGIVERAADHLRKVFDVDPTHVGARERLAAVLVELGRKAEAVKELEILGEQLVRSAPAEAEKHVRRALALDPQAPRALGLLERLENPISSRTIPPTMTRRWSSIRSRSSPRGKRPRPCWRSWTPLRWGTRTST
jgi:tetratricopeptide (TPR) repeat protein